jgi:probable HAF family extracellular repeat protein
MKAHLFAGPLALLALLSCAPIATAQSTTAISYRVDPIPLPYPDVDMHPLALNNRGDVVGYTFGAGGYRGFIFSGGQTREIPGLGGLYGTYGVGINDSGVACGYSYRPGNPDAVMFQYSGGVTTDLGQAPPGYSTFPTAINNAGQIAGYDQDTSVHGDRGFRWTNGNFENLGTIGNAQDSGAAAINDLGDMAGAVVLNNQERPAIYTDGAFRYIGTSTGRALGINNARIVVGDLDVSRRGFFYDDTTGVFLSVSPLSGMGPELHLQDVNNLGQAVSTPAGLYTRAGGLIDLNTLIDPASGWQLINTAAINDAGQIIGIGTYHGSGPAAFILTPIPEPTGCALAAGVGPAIAIAHRRRRRTG